MQPAAYLAQHREEHLKALFALLAIPSVSAIPQHAPDVRRAATHLADFMRQIGLEHVALHETEGHPVVYGDYLHAPGRPTVLVYGHYDVQPVDPLALWETPPFEPTVRDGKVFARGATDDKGQMMMHLFVAQGMIAQGSLKVNLRFLIEGEEEVGSTHLAAFVAAHKELLGADYVVISDSPMLRPGVPALCVGLRGLSALEFTLRTAEHDLHSGNFGGAVPNAAHELAALIATLHRADGSIAVEGFYDGVRDLSKNERAAFDALGFSDEELRQQSGAFALFGEGGRTTLERVWSRPTLEVNGMWSGFVGEGRKTVVPAEARAKITCRLVPEQDPDAVAKAVAAHLRRYAPAWAQLEVTFGGGDPAFLAPPGHPALEAARKALEEAYGKALDEIRMGGSIPVVTTFREELGLPTLLMGFGLPDENLHAPNEHFSLENFAKGMLALWRFYESA
ncbi:MAG: dipeptidase [Thermaerobacter sp.]|nr:dipeptidase [Thermaerobacter sp.]